MGEKYNAWRTAWVFTFMVVVSVSIDQMIWHWSDILKIHYDIEEFLICVQLI